MLKKWVLKLLTCFFFNKKIEIAVSVLSAFTQTDRPAKDLESFLDFLFFLNINGHI